MTDSQKIWALLFFFSKGPHPPTLVPPSQNANTLSTQRQIALHSTNHNQQHLATYIPVANHMFYSLSCDTKPRPICGITESASGTRVSDSSVTGADPSSWRIWRDFWSDSNAPCVDWLLLYLLKILKTVCKPSLRSHNAQVADFIHKIKKVKAGGSCARNRNCHQ